MSEDEDLAEREAIERELEKEEYERQDAFYHGFTLEAFVGVARALKMPVDEAHLLHLGGVLLTRFYAFYQTCSATGQSRRETKAQVKQLRDAANLLTSSFETVLALFTLNQIEETETETDIFIPTAKRLAKH